MGAAGGGCWGGGVPLVVGVSHGATPPPPCVEVEGERGGWPPPPTHPCRVAVPPRRRGRVWSRGTFSAACLAGFGRPAPPRPRLRPAGPRPLGSTPPRPAPPRGAHSPRTGIPRCWVWGGVEVFFLPPRVLLPLAVEPRPEPEGVAWAAGELRAGQTDRRVGTEGSELGKIRRDLTPVG